MILTYQKLLRRGDVCDAYLNHFEELFGLKRVKVTAALCAKHAAHFSWTGAAYRLLNEDGQAKFRAAEMRARKRYGAAIGATEKLKHTCLLTRPRPCACCRAVTIAQQAQRLSLARAFGRLAEKQR